MPKDGNKSIAKLGIAPFLSLKAFKSLRIPPLQKISFMMISILIQFSA